MEQAIMWSMLGVIVVVFVGFMIFSSRKRKKQEQEAQDIINAVGPGNKVKTIGGICGIVVEVDNEENTFVLETGSVTAGKSYIKFDKLAIYQTDAVAPDKKEKDKEKPAEDTPAEEVFETPAEAEAPAETQEETKE